MSAPREIGRDDAARKLAALHAITSATIAAVEPPLDYWRDDAAQRRAHAEALIAAHARARSRLIAEYGDGAARDPLFRALFHPLDHRFPAFTSAEQIAIHEAELRLSAAVLQSADPRSRDATYERHVSRLAQQIGAAAAFEYAVRTSPLSQQIRASTVELDEAEFRETYTLLSTLNRGDTSPAAFYGVRRALRALLGSERFTAFWAARDPQYAELVRIGRRFDLGNATVMSAYAVLNDSQDAMLAAALEASGDGASNAARLRELYATSRARLAAIVGEDVARAITIALSTPGAEARPFARD